MSAPSTTGPLDRSAPILVAGSGGLVGSSIVAHLTASGFTSVLGPRSREVDLTDRQATFRYLGATRPRYVIDAAARVGGIGANSAYPYDFISTNLQIQVNLMDAALAHSVERFLFLGSTCIYPRLAAQPIKESALLTGPLEPTNAAYAVAKIAGIQQVQAARDQHGAAWISAMPTNVYGPGDNFSREGSHVLPALIRRYVEAAQDSRPVVTNWGSGRPRREFIHTLDLARACVHLLDTYDGDSPVNVGVGEDVTLRELATLVADVAGYRGKTEWDTSRPDGTPRKLTDTGLLRSLGWEPTISLKEGVDSVVRWYLDNQATARL